jgi:ADP-ribose pyrophosphatase YjhB (NUDIX family)
MGQPAPQPMTHSNVKLIATLSVLTGDSVAFVTYRRAPDSEAGLFLPNDLLRGRENPYTAAKRIAREQLGIGLKEPLLFDVDSFDGNDGTWHIAFHFRGEVAEAGGVKPSEEVTSLQWMSLDALPDKSKIAHGGWFNGIATRARRHRMRFKTSG